MPYDNNNSNEHVIDIALDTIMVHRPSGTSTVMVITVIFGVGAFG
jgi:hypothetical protein